MCYQGFKWFQLPINCADSGPTAPQHCEEGSNGKGGTCSTGFFVENLPVLDRFFGGCHTIYPLGMFGEESYLGNFTDAIPFLETRKIRSRCGQGRSSTNRLRHDTPCAIAVDRCNVGRLKPWRNITACWTSRKNNVLMNWRHVWSDSWAKASKIGGVRSWRVQKMIKVLVHVLESQGNGGDTSLPLASIICKLSHM